MVRFAQVAHPYPSSVLQEHTCPKQVPLQPSHATRALQSTIAQHGASPEPVQLVRTRSTSARLATCAWEVLFTLRSVMTSLSSSAPSATSAIRATRTATVSQVNFALSTSTSRFRARACASLALLVTAVLPRVLSILLHAREVTTAQRQRGLSM